MLARAALAVVASFSLVPVASAEPSGRLVAAFAAEPTTLDRVRYSAGVDTYGIGQVFEQLLRVDLFGKRIS